MQRTKFQYLFGSLASDDAKRPLCEGRHLDLSVDLLCLMLWAGHLTRTSPPHEECRLLTCSV